MNDQAKPGYQTCCPSCGLKDSVQVAATVWGLFTPEGFDSDADDLPSYDNDFDEHAGAICPECGHRGNLSDFQPE